MILRIGLRCQYNVNVPSPSSPHLHLRWHAPTREERPRNDPAMFPSPRTVRPLHRIKPNLVERLPCKPSYHRKSPSIPLHTKPLNCKDQCRNHNGDQTSNKSSSNLSPTCPTQATSSSNLAAARQRSQSRLQRQSSRILLAYISSPERRLMAPQPPQVTRSRPLQHS